MFREKIIPAIYISLGVIILFLLSLYAVLVFRLPSYNGTVRTTQVKASVQIYRDSAGMPHIIADSEELLKLLICIAKTSRSSPQKLSI